MPLFLLLVGISFSFLMGQLHRTLPSCASAEIPDVLVNGLHSSTSLFPVPKHDLAPPESMDLSKYFLSVIPFNSQFVVLARTITIEFPARTYVNMILYVNVIVGNYPYTILMTTLNRSNYRR